METALAAGNENPLWFQQRLKITFRKTGVVNQQQADGYKATLRIGSDTYVDTEWVINRILPLQMPIRVLGKAAN